MLKPLEVLPRERKTNKEDPYMAQSWKFINPFNPSSIKLSMNMLFKGISEVFSNRR
jgi:hypothetical protein